MTEAFKRRHYGQAYYREQIKVLKMDYARAQQEADVLRKENVLLVKRHDHACWLLQQWLRRALA